MSASMNLLRTNSLMGAKVVKMVQIPNCNHHFKTVTFATFTKVTVRRPAVLNMVRKHNVQADEHTLFRKQQETEQNDLG